MNNPGECIAGFSHSFDQGVAIKYGMAAAVVFNHIIYWLRFNFRKKDAELIEGKTWMYETQEAISESLGYLSYDEVKKAIKQLLDAGLLIKGNFNKNPFDKTNWYTVFDQKLIENGNNSNKSYESAIRRDRQRPTAPSVEPSGSIYTIEEQQKKNCSVLLARVREENEKIPEKESVDYTTSSGEKKTISSSEIFKHFIKSTYSTDIIKRAIKIANDCLKPINDVLKFLDATCKNLREKDDKQQKSLSKEVKTIQNKQVEKQKQIIKEEKLYDNNEKVFAIVNGEVKEIKSRYKR